MKTKDDFINKLRNDALYKTALSNAKNDQERAEIGKVVEQMVGDFGSAFESILYRIQNDPEFTEELRKAVISGEIVVSEDETRPSGSSDE